MPFKKDPKIKTTIDPGTDKVLPPRGPQIPLNIGALQKQEVAFVGGDLGSTVTGDATYKVSGDLETSVMSNEKHTIAMDRQLNVAGDQNATVVGTHNVLQIGPKNDTNVSPHNRMNSSPDSQDEPAEKMRIFGVVFEHKQSEQTVTDMKMELLGFGVAFSGMKTESTGVNLEVKVVDFATVLGIAVEPKVSEVELKALHVFLEGAEGKVAALSGAVAPSVNVVPHIPTAGGN
jgi:hypothetical protein